MEARNEHGLGEASTRIVFRTASKTIEDLLDTEHPYNQTECCQKSGMKQECKIFELFPWMIESKQ